MIKVLTSRYNPIDTNNNNKFSEFQRVSTALNKKIKIKSISQNNRKKVRRDDLNKTVQEPSLIDNIMRFSKPVKNSKTKLNTTLAIYNKNFLPSTVSNREANNSSNNSKANNKKGLVYMKQMMNRTVLIQNQDYHSLNYTIPNVKNKIHPRMDSKKKNSLVIPKQVMMVMSQN